MIIETVPIVDVAADDTAAPERTRSTGIASVVARRIGVGVAALALLTVVLWALFPAALAPFDPIVGEPSDNLLPPSPQHWFGTDNVGRDVFSRTVHGSALSLQASLIAVLFGVVVGSALGLLSGVAGGPLDVALMRLVDVLLAIPALLVSLMVVSVLGFGTMNVAIAVGLASVGTFARVMRSEVVKVRGLDFVEASRGLGSSSPKIVFTRILPNSVGAVFGLAALEVGSAILAISSLSFLGFGAQPPLPEWGNIVAEGRNFLATAWWITVLPGLVIVAVVLAINYLSRSLHRAGVQ